MRGAALAVLAACGFPRPADVPGDAPGDALDGGFSGERITYVKASNTDPDDRFGLAIALSADGTTLAVGAPFEESAATGIDGDQDDDSVEAAGAVYVFVRAADGWTQQAYLKASNTGASDRFGFALALSADGGTLAVGAPGESSAATGVDGDQLSDGVSTSGAVYLFVRTDGSWMQRAYLKASNTGLGDEFGTALALAGDASRLFVGAPREDSNATGADGDQANEDALNSGAVYVFDLVEDPLRQVVYLKGTAAAFDLGFGEVLAASADGSRLAVGVANDGNSRGLVHLYRIGIDDDVEHLGAAGSDNADPGDAFGSSITLSGDGEQLVVGASLEDSAEVGIAGAGEDDTARDAGAVYVFAIASDEPAQVAYLKASNTGRDDRLGSAVALADATGQIVTSAPFENGGGLDLDPAVDEAAAGAGALYVYAPTGATSWAPPRYVKATNTGAEDRFGHAVASSRDGTVVVVSAPVEDGLVTGVGGGTNNDLARDSGAVYIYE